MLLLAASVVVAKAKVIYGGMPWADRIGGSVLEAVEGQLGRNGKQQTLPFGAFSFNRRNADLRNVINAQLRLYLGSPNRRARMACFGLTQNEVNPTLDQGAPLSLRRPFPKSCFKLL
jgi:polar amino acid transport system substrate-binding protein